MHMLHVFCRQEERSAPAERVGGPKESISCDDSILILFVYLVFNDIPFLYSMLQS